jgi:hypothetical protein
MQTAARPTGPDLVERGREQAVLRRHRARAGVHEHEGPRAVRDLCLADLKAALRAREALRRPKRCQLAHALLWEYSNKASPAAGPASGPA